jgi:hypothetical protein
MRNGVCMNGFFSALGPTNVEIGHAHAREQDCTEVCSQHLSLIHAGRRELWCAAVSAVMGGHMLSLSRLARGLMGQSTQKAALKRVDRLWAMHALVRKPKWSQQRCCARCVGAGSHW